MPVASMYSRETMGVSAPVPLRGIAKVEADATPPSSSSPLGKWCSVTLGDAWRRWVEVFRRAGFLSEVGGGPSRSSTSTGALPGTPRYLATAPPDAPPLSLSSVSGVEAPRFPPGPTGTPMMQGEAKSRPVASPALGVATTPASFSAQPSWGSPWVGPRLRHLARFALHPIV